MNFCAAPWQRLGGRRTLPGQPRGLRVPFLASCLAGLQGGERLPGALGSAGARTGAGGYWGFRRFRGRTQDFSISALPEYKSETLGGEEGGERSKRRAAWTRMQEAIKTPPFGLTTKN